LTNRSVFNGHFPGCYSSISKLFGARQALVNRDIIKCHEKSGSASPDYEFLCLYNVQIDDKTSDPLEHNSDTNSTQPAGTHIYNKKETKREETGEFQSPEFSSDYSLEDDSSTKKIPGARRKK
jgi:hypothetical protein